MCSCEGTCDCGYDDDEINEIRYYLGFVLNSMHPAEIAEEDKDYIDPVEPFVPQYIITAVKLPTGAIEIAVNDKFIEEKIKYILDAYDDNMHLKTNQDIVMQNIMIV